jgi:hypothetical protein
MVQFLLAIWEAASWCGLIKRQGTRLFVVTFGHQQPGISLTALRFATAEMLISDDTHTDRRDAVSVQY